MKIPHDPNELLTIVDENDQVIGKHPRKTYVDGKLHRQTSLLLFNKKKELLIQIRSDNERLDPSSSGHVPYNDSYLESQIRETKEEMGLKIPKKLYQNVGKFRIKTRKGLKVVNDRFMTVFVVHADYKISQLTPQPGEVKEFKYLSIQDLEKVPKKDKTKSLRESIKLIKKLKLV